MEYTGNVVNSNIARPSSRRKAPSTSKKAQWALMDKGQNASPEQWMQLMGKILNGLEIVSHEPSISITAGSIVTWAKDIPPSANSRGVLMAKEGRLALIFDEVRQQYKLRDDEKAIFDFIIDLPSMAVFLLDMAKEIQNKFGAMADISLSIEGTEIGEESYLYARVLTELPVAEALDKVDDIDRDWLIDNLDRVQGRFNFDVEWK